MSETIQVRCPNCEAALKVPAAVAGKKIRCRGCQTVFTAAAAPPPKTGGGGGTFKVADDPAPPPGKAKPVKPSAPAADPNRVARPYDEDEDTGPAEYGLIKGDDEVPRCPFCAKELDPPDTKICLTCGFDLFARRRHENKVVYELTTGDYVKHFLPAVACVLLVIALIAVDVICIMNMGDWFAGSIFEMDDTDPNTGKKKFYLPPSFCNVWIVVPSLFIIWKAGKFAGKRFILQPKPPETVKKK